MVFASLRFIGLVCFVHDEFKACSLFEYTMVIGFVVLLVLCFFSALNHQVGSYFLYFLESVCVLFSEPPPMWVSNFDA